MSVFKSQFSRALKVIPSDNANIPNPFVITTGTNTSTTANQLINSAAFFVTKNVAVGDVVYNTTDSTAATVVLVINETTIVLNADIFTATGKAYVIYQNSSQTGLPNQGCNLYIGGAGAATVTTIGNDIVTFSGLLAGTVLPVQVNKVANSGGTTATNIIALW
jgi:hypothetical protein